MAYYAGDIPAQPLAIEPALDLEGWDTVTAELVNPDPDVESVELTANIVEGMITVEWPAETVLPNRGMYDLRLTLNTVGGARQRLPRVTIVVQDDTDGWHTLDSAREVWPDAPETDRWLYELLEVAKVDCTNYRPLQVGEIPGESYRRAQQLHARDLWNASEVDSGGGLGEGTFAIQPHPLDWMVKQILRPKRGTFVVG